MNITALMFAAATALMVVGLALVAVQVYTQRTRRNVSTRLSSASDIPDFRAEQGEQLGALALAGRGMERWLQDGDESVTLLLNRAGWRDASKRSLFYMTQFGLPIVAVTAVLLMEVPSGKLSNLELFLSAFAAFAVGILLPRYVLRGAARKRQGRVSVEVPMFVHMLVMLYDAGLSTRQALHSLVRDGQDVLPELNIEFRSVLRQLDAGADLVQVLSDLETDLDVPELSNVLGLLRQIERFGGEVRESLLSALELIEERRALSLRERVNHMAGRMTVVMVGFFFPALLLCVAGPAFMAIVFALGSAT